MHRYPVPVLQNIRDTLKGSTDQYGSLCGLDSDLCCNFVKQKQRSCCRALHYELRCAKPAVAVRPHVWQKLMYKSKKRATATALFSYSVLCGVTSGAPVYSNNNSLTAGQRGASLSVCASVASVDCG